MLDRRKAILILWTLVLGLGLAIMPVAAENDNTAPVFEPIPRQYILEGDKLNLLVSAGDPDGDGITLGVVVRPFGAVFADHGDGTATFEWQPDFIGPNSSDGSPFTVAFQAADGWQTSAMETEIVVINKNRRPSITCPDTVSVASGTELHFEVSGFDPDFDSLTWTILEAPEPLSYSAGDQVAFDWKTAFADSGYYDVCICLTDRHGAADTANIVLNIQQADVYLLSIDTISAYPGEFITVNINLENLTEILGFNVVVNYDVSVLSIATVSKAETRAEYFEYFTYRLNYRGIQGDINVFGLADINDGAIADNLAPGSGPLASLALFVTTDLNYAGYSIPINFTFRDYPISDDNTLLDPDSVRIDQESIDYSGGYVRIEKTSPSSLGDINLNGVAYEIGDAVYFTNFFISPESYPLNPVQWLNSDVNQDGYGGTIADLVYMRNVLLNLIPGSRKLGIGLTDVYISSETYGQRLHLYYDSEVELGGMALILESPGRPALAPGIFSSMGQKGITVKWADDGDLVRVVMYGEDGNIMPSGLNKFLEIENNSDFKIKEIQLSSSDGLLLNPVMKNGGEALTPKGFVLYQNYPNPFNPTTGIAFALPDMSPVTLTVFNVLGQEVITLVDEMLPAGQHSVVWNGRDNHGNAVSSGIYFYRLHAGRFLAEKKMILLK